MKFGTFAIPELIPVKPANAGDFLSSDFEESDLPTD
jgi:hypothetical protein